MTRRDLFLQTPVALLVLSCTRPSAEALRPLLNSERIELIFGSYGVEVLESDEQIRVSSLYSSERGRRTCRTFAVTFFPSALDPRLEAAHREILAGGSIGAVFKKAGYRVEKKHRYFGELPPSRDRARLQSLMGEAGESRLAVHVYAMTLAQGGATIDYATIAEVYHPSFMSLEGLRDIYGGETVKAHATTDPELERLLDRVRAELR